MFLIIGLGNPGLKYKKTRHNAGFLAVDFVVEKLLGKKAKWNKSKKAKTEYIWSKINNTEVEFLKPQTFMNNSGEAVKTIINYYKIETKNIIVIYDEFDLPFGKIRVRQNGSSAGHNGIKSIIQHLGTDNFWRMRIGVSNPEYSGQKKIPTDLIKLHNGASKFILKKFSRQEQKELNEKIFPEVIEKIQEIIK